MPGHIKWHNIGGVMKDILIVTIQAIVCTVIIAFVDILLFNHIHKILTTTVFISSYIDLAVKRLREE